MTVDMRDTAVKTEAGEKGPNIELVSYGNLKLGGKRPMRKDSVRRQTGINTLKGWPAAISKEQLSPHKEQYSPAYCLIMFPLCPSTLRGDHYSRQLQFIPLPCNRKGLTQSVIGQKPTNPR